MPPKPLCALVPRRLSDGGRFSLCDEGDCVLVCMFVPCLISPPEDIDAA